MDLYFLAPKSPDQFCCLIPFCYAFSETNLVTQGNPQTAVNSLPDNYSMILSMAISCSPC